jgi:penicillin-binding protein 1C
MYLLQPVLIRIYLWLLKRAKVALIIFILFLFLLYLIPLPKNSILQGSSLKVFSSEKILLKSFRDSDGTFSDDRLIQSVPQFILEAIIEAEDKRFYYHIGIDPFAMLRAFYQNVKSMKVISGASTISQQLSRIIYKKYLPKNKYIRKVLEIFFALHIEVHLSKQEILEYYINKIPMSFNRTGIFAASEYMFSKDIQYLSIEEAIALAVAIRQNKFTKQSFETRVKLLAQKFSIEGISTEDLYSKIYSSKKNVSGRSIDSAKHYYFWLKETFPQLKGNFYSYLSIDLNNKILDIIKNEMKSLYIWNTQNAAIVVLEISNSEIEQTLKLRGMVGSSDFYSDDGQNNGALAIRDAGSTLKPLLYALAFDLEKLYPNTILSDTETIFYEKSSASSYIPHNNDMRYWGNITVREALANSRNIPAIKTLEKVGVGNFYNFLKNLEWNHIKKEEAHYGLSIAMGTTGTSLLQLSRAYSIFPNKGMLYPITLGKDDFNHQLLIGEKKKLLSEKSTYKITHILSDGEIRRRGFGKRNFLDFPYPVAAKTGSSKDFRDAWTVGFTGRYIVGVWVGNFDGKQMSGVTGAWGAGRIFHQVIRTLTDTNTFVYPSQFYPLKLCRKTGLQASEYCPSYIELSHISDPDTKKCNGEHGSLINKNSIPEILSPVSGEVFIIEKSKPIGFQKINISLQCNACNLGEYYYSVNHSSKEKLVKDIHFFKEPSPGSYTIELYSKNELLQKVSFYIKESKL